MFKELNNKSTNKGKTVETEQISTCLAFSVEAGIMEVGWEHRTFSKWRRGSKLNYCQAFKTINSLKSLKYTLE